ncbi:helix-turn-helix transcriptional regulator [Streptacidiphilus sp. PB12-B1b]|uniref:helix-turn-helix transcriptional regulator n=1 Tax=Streptacidiphilus sp. PB12-B1b TaxID=2705012 RepID=UPI0015FB8B15|nr:helix-turn-helix transcriptional regulator [Streptacidiphilus sp. PB12-B1b]QMU78000.1 helix-turn-helix transcriptional regulator [Streptacidiphilus sp. PB12-B1b]
MYWEPGEFWEPGGQAASGDDAERRLLIADRLCQGSSALLEALCVLAGQQPLATVARVAAVPASARIFSLLLGLGLVVSVDGPQHTGSQQTGLIALARESDGRMVRGRLSPTRWRALHRAAAEVLEPRPALAHRALAADRPDPALAAALEEAALDGHAPDSEISMTTRQLLLWAADLSTERAERERRLLLAAMHDVYGERLSDGDLWARVEELPPSPLRYCALAGRALLEDRLGAAVDHLRAAGRAHDAGHTHLQLDAASDAASAAGAIATVEAAVACRTARGRAAIKAATRALDAGSCDAVQVRMAQRLLLAGRGYVDGPLAVLHALDGHAELADAGPSALRDSGLVLLRGESCLLAGELESAVRDLDGLVRLHDADPGHPDRLRALERLALAYVQLGDWQRADHALDRIDETGGDTVGQALRSMLSAVRGTGPAPRRGARLPASTATASADPDRPTIAAFADALALLAHRRHADILAAITWPPTGSVGQEDAPAKFAPLWLPVYAEALIETSTVEPTALAELHACADGLPYLRVAYHRLTGRAAELRRDPVAAGEAYQAALSAAEGCAQLPPLHRAQLDHAYGRFLCARGRTATGLARLQRAQDAFASLGALAFVRGCAEDRAAVTRAPAPCPDIALTEREATVAGLVVSGLTNRQVAEELRISAKAVEYHLGKIYRKLGVCTRRELRDVHGF